MSCCVVILFIFKCNFIYIPRLVSNLSNVTMAVVSDYSANVKQFYITHII